jgi:hypothetical protein
MGLGNLRQKAKLAASSTRGARKAAPKRAAKAARRKPLRKSR